MHSYSDHMRLTPPENYHITVSFVGETEEKQAAQIQKVLQEIAQDTQPFSLPFETLREAPPSGEKNMAWATYTPTSEFMDLVHTVESTVREVTHYPDSRKGHTPIPHITLARFKRGTDIALENTYIPAHHIPVTSLNLYESKLTPSGSKYSVLSSYSL
jgi:RNA 2',3'-cyclic 3'-phosphodiesterase